MVEEGCEVRPRHVMNEARTEDRQELGCGIANGDERGVGWGSKSGRKSGRRSAGLPGTETMTDEHGRSILRAVVVDAPVSGWWYGAGEVVVGEA